MPALRLHLPKNPKDASSGAPQALIDSQLAASDILCLPTPFDDLSKTSLTDQRLRPCNESAMETPRSQSV
jgi:hypothetical protein